MPYARHFITPKEVDFYTFSIWPFGQLEVIGIALMGLPLNLIKASGLGDWCPTTIADH